MPKLKAQVLQEKLAELKIPPSHSRLRVSNDNAHVESLFRTLKYLPAWPEAGFAKLEGARARVKGFVGWYNEEHRHRGEDRLLMEKRNTLYLREKRRDPLRYSGQTRNWNRHDEV